MKIIKKLVKTLIGTDHVNRIQSLIFSSNLNKLAQIYGSDKFGRHNYTKVYEQYFRKIRKNKLKILEIGVGGYNLPNEGGASLRMWKRYFPKSRIFSIDIYDKSLLEEKRISIFKGSQDDCVFLNDLISRTGSFDIIIDDGSHINKHVIISFEFLFDKLNKCGIYVIEDVETSYREDMGGCSINLNSEHTAMNYFKRLVDVLNKEYYDSSIFVFEKFTLNIESVHFYNNMIIIQKK